MASAAITAVCCRMIEIVAGEANRGLTMVNAMKATTSTSNGLIAGWECNRCWTRWTGDCRRIANCSAAVVGVLVGVVTLIRGFLAEWGGRRMTVSRPRREGGTDP